jgi:thiol:disulfide interchange protein DsbD
MLDQIVQYASYKLVAALLFFATMAIGNSVDLPAVPPKAGVVSPASPAINEVLDPEVAFQPQFRLRDATNAEIKFDVLPGYYLYRDRIHIEGMVAEPQVGGRGVKAKQFNDTPQTAIPLILTTPRGRFVEDPTFGRVEIYDRSIVLQFSLAVSTSVSSSTVANSRSPAVKVPNKFRLTSQGCAAAGVCFPPQQHEFALPATVSGTRDSRTAENVWVLPIAAATSLGFGRPKKPSASTIPSK